nr:hypothetical protein [Acinetobacter lwoffii]
MDIQKKREAFERLPEIEMGLQEYPDIKFEKDGYVYYGSNTITALAACYVGGAWMAWQLTKAQAVPEGFVLMPKEPTDEIIEAMNEFDYRNDYSDMDGAYRTIVETLEKAQEDAEREQTNDSR